MVKALGGCLLGGKHSDHRMSVAQLLHAQRLPANRRVPSSLSPPSGPCTLSVDGATEEDPVQRAGREVLHPCESGGLRRGWQLVTCSG